MAIIDASLTVTRNGDGAHFQNCMEAFIDGQAPVSLGCNRPAPYPASYGGANLVSAVTIKLKTGVCNVLKLRMFSRQSPGGASTLKLDTNVPSTVFSPQNVPSRGPGFLISKVSDQFTIGANDNNDNRWVDLNLSIKGDGRAKFTMQGTNIPCD